tara:strand:+ start:1614 stop:1952 length:339 start_codon:yes stop_codon:yes gene_type:complete
MKISELLNEIVNIDHKISKVSQEKNLLTEKKKKLSNSVIRFMKDKNMDTLNHDSNNFSLKQSKSYSSISQKLLKDSLSKYLNNEKTEKELLQLILNNRTEKDNIDLKINTIS